MRLNSASGSSAKNGRRFGSSRGTRLLTACIIGDLLWAVFVKVSGAALGLAPKREQSPVFTAFRACGVPAASLQP